LGKKEIENCDMKKVFVFFIVAISLMSCYDNQIYFDISEQCVKTCNGRPVKSLYFEGNNNLYLFEKISGKEGSSIFCLNDLDRNYKLAIMNIEMPLDSFRLKPNSEYKISNHTYGDAAFSEIKIKTNESGEIVTADVASCQ
jgi:hypothetical protein